LPVLVIASTGTDRAKYSGAWTCLLDAPIERRIVGISYSFPELVSIITLPKSDTRTVALYRTRMPAYAAFSSSRKTVSPMTRVETRPVLGCTMSLVRTPEASARRTAPSTRSAYSAMSKE
jgi:hypothetical protein